MDLIEGKDAFLRWLEAKGFSPGTVKNRAVSMRALIEFLKTNAVNDAREVTRQNVDEYKTWVMKRFCWWGGHRLAQSSVEKHLLTARRFFDFLARRGVLMMNPAAHLTWPGERRELPKNIPTEKEMEEILVRPDTGTHRGMRDRAILEVFYSTGIRRRELVKLDLYDVNLAEGTLTVRYGKGGKGRTVPLVGAAQEFLVRYLREVRPLMVGARWAVPARGKTAPAGTVGRETPLFIEPGGRRIKTAAVGRMVKWYVRPVNPAAPLSCHIIRHAFATHMLRGGADVRLIQQMLGHARLSTTEIYTTVQTIDLKAEHERCHPRGGKANEDHRSAGKVSGGLQGEENRQVGVLGPGDDHAGVFGVHEDAPSRGGGAVDGGAGRGIPEAAPRAGCTDDGEAPFTEDRRGASGHRAVLPGACDGARVVAEEPGAVDHGRDVATDRDAFPNGGGGGPGLEQAERGGV